MTKFAQLLVTGATWVAGRLRGIPIAAKSGAPQPGPHWRAFDVVVRERRLYGATVFGWSIDHAERKAWLMWARSTDGLEFDRKEIEALDMKVREAL